MRELKFSREEIIQMVKDKFLNARSIFHFDVCQALHEHKTQSEIAEEKDISETKGIRYIKEHKCKYCDLR